MPLDHAVLLLLVEAGDLPLGALVRLRRVDRATRALVDGASDAFLFFATRTRWGALRAAAGVGARGELGALATLRRAARSRCRECGATTRCTAFLESRVRSYQLCTACQRDASGYLQLVDRAKIRAMAKAARVPSLRVMRGLPAVRRGFPAAKFLYLRASADACVDAARAATPARRPAAASAASTTLYKCAN